MRFPGRPGGQEAPSALRETPSLRTNWHVEPPSPCSRSPLPLTSRALYSAPKTSSPRPSRGRVSPTQSLLWWWGISPTAQHASSRTPRTPRTRASEKCEAEGGTLDRCKRQRTFLFQNCPHNLITKTTERVTQRVFEWYILSGIFIVANKRNSTYISGSRVLRGL